MNGAALIFTLQCFAAVAWGVLVIRKWPAVCRVWTGRGSGDDLPRAVIWFLAAGVELGVIRWLCYPHVALSMSGSEIFTWAGVYVLSIVAAIGLSWAYWDRRHAR